MKKNQVGTALNLETMTFEAHELNCANLKRIARGNAYNIVRYASFSATVTDFVTKSIDLDVCDCISRQFAHISMQFEEVR